MSLLMDIDEADHEGIPQLKEVVLYGHGELTHELLGNRLAEFIDFYSLTKKKDELDERFITKPPKDVSLSIQKLRSLAHIRRLEQITTYPYYDKNWEFRNEPGYNSDTRIYLDPSRKIDLDEELDDVHKAMNYLEQWLKDFKFKDGCDKANALSLLFTLALRLTMEDENKPPLFIITANMPGAGKSTLAQAVAAAIIGGFLGSTILGSTEEEIKKQLGSELHRGSNIVVFDNIPDNKPLISHTLAQVLTDVWIHWRLLGKSKMIKSKNNAVVIMTGNDTEAHKELLDRAVVIKLHTEEPASVREFATRQFGTDTIRNHNKIWTCIHTIVEGYKNSVHKDRDGSKSHRFRQWSSDISGIFDFILDTTKDVVDDKGQPIYGYLDKFLDNVNEQKLEADPEQNMWIKARNAIWSRLDSKDERWSVRCVFDLLSGRDPKSDSQARFDLNLLDSKYYKDHPLESQRRANVSRYINKLVKHSFMVGKYRLKIDPSIRTNDVNWYYFEDTDPKQVDQSENVQFDQKPQPQEDGYDDPENYDEENPPVL